jgi:hypothetical protein
LVNIYVYVYTYICIYVYTHIYPSYHWSALDVPILSLLTIDLDLSSSEIRGNTSKKVHIIDVSTDLKHVPENEEQSEISVVIII